MAIGSLRASKLRSFLTLLGIILATATLIAVMSIINGMNVYVAEKIADLGADGFVVVRMAFLGDFSPKKFLELLKKNPELGIRGVRVPPRATPTLLRELGMRSGTNAASQLRSTAHGRGQRHRRHRQPQRPVAIRRSKAAATSPKPRTRATAWLSSSGTT